MANNIIKRVWNQNKMVNIEALQGMAFQAEDGGHTFEISGVDDSGATVSLSGTVAGVFRRADNADIALIGAASDGKVSVTLTDDCYAVPGRFVFTIFVTSGGQKTAVYAAVGTVSVTSGGGVAGDTPQDVVDLINAIAAAVATIPASYSGLMADIAPTYSSSAVYSVGAYVYYNGDLYRCTTDITTAETWTAAHWTSVSIGNDLKTGVITRGSLTSSSDMNDVKNAGYYFKDSGVTVSNGVNSHRAKVVCFNSPVGQNYALVQLWFDCYDNDLYFRTLNYPNATWGSWKKVISSDSVLTSGNIADGSITDAKLNQSTSAFFAKAVTGRSALTSSSDMNTLKQAGYYFKDANVSVQNGVGLNRAKIVVFSSPAGDGSSNSQLWFDCVANKLYFRTLNLSSSTWGNWLLINAKEPETIYSASDCITAFVSAMNAMAAKVGMTDTTATSPSGLSWDGRTTAKDLLRLATVASGYDRLCRIWGKKSHTINYYHGGTLTSTTVTTSVANETLEASYHILGGKTGSSYEDEGQSDAINNLVMIASDNKGRAVVGSVVEANGMTNRFNAMKKLLDNAFAKLDDPSATPTSITTAECAIAWALPPYSGSMCEGYDLPVLYSQNPTNSHGTASTIKVLTAITALDILTNEDLQTWYTMTADDIIGGSGAIFSSGDKVKIIDLFYAMMLPSSNMSAQAIAHLCGQKILSNTTP